MVITGSISLNESASLVTLFTNFIVSDFNVHSKQFINPDEIMEMRNQYVATKTAKHSKPPSTIRIRRNVSIETICDHPEPSAATQYRPEYNQSHL